jgi:hypothetical protein
MLMALTPTRSVIGGALALTLSLSGCAGAGDTARGPNGQATPAESSQVGGDSAENEPVGQAEASPIAGGDLEATSDLEPTSAPLPTAVPVEGSGVITGTAPIGSASGGGPAGGSASSASSQVDVSAVARTETIVVGEDGALSADQVEMATGEVIALALSNRSDENVLMRLPLGDTGELAVMLLGLGSSGSTGIDTSGDQGGTSTTGTSTTGGSSGTTGTSTTGTSTTGTSTTGTSTTGTSTTGTSTTGTSTTGGSTDGTTGGNAGSTGGPSGQPDTSATSSSDSIITDPAAAVPTVEAGNPTESGSSSGSVGGSDAVNSGGMAQVGDLAANPTVLLLRFDEAGVYTISCAASSPESAGSEGSGCSGEITITVSAGAASDTSATPTP